MISVSIDLQLEPSGGCRRRKRDYIIEGYLSTAKTKMKTAVLAKLATAAFQYWSSPGWFKGNYSVEDLVPDTSMQTLWQI